MKSVKNEFIYSKRLLIILLLGYFLSACGGGGSNNDAAASATTLPDKVSDATLIGVPVKSFKFIWSDVGNASYYKILENFDGDSGFVQIGENIRKNSQEYIHIVPIIQRVNAQYIIQSCNGIGCTDSEMLTVDSEILTNAIGNIKASLPKTGDDFGSAVSLSGDGLTLAVGSEREDSVVDFVNNTTISSSGAVHIFALDSNNVWQQQARLEASNLGYSDRFGSSLSLNGDGSLLAVSALGDSSDANGIDGNQFNNNAIDSGSVYIFSKDKLNHWSQSNYIKASNTGERDHFGASVSLSNDGLTLAVGAPNEDSNSVGVGSEQDNDLSLYSGAVYIFERKENDNVWYQKSYIKADNAQSRASFGSSLELDATGNKMVVGAPNHSSTLEDSGAVYVFSKNETVWLQEAYLKASNSDYGDFFGASVSVSGDGQTIVVGAPYEDSSSIGINGDEGSDFAKNSGAAYIFSRNSLSGWQQSAYLKASIVTREGNFGWTVDLNYDGNFLVVGAIGESTFTVNSGAIFSFTNNGIWQPSYWFKAKYADSNSLFGRSLAINNSGETVAVGAPWAHRPHSSGEIFLY